MTATLIKDGKVMDCWKTDKLQNLIDLAHDIEQDTQVISPVYGIPTDSYDPVWSLRYEQGNSVLSVQSMYESAILRLRK